MVSGPAPVSAQIADYVRVGFTGTRHGMTRPQRHTVSLLLHQMKPSWVHHGDCVGADADFHHLAHRIGINVMIHPPTDDKLRARLVGDDIAEEKPYLSRNADIVNACDLLIATPAEDGERYEGGTWHTIHYARKQGKPNFVVWPDGSTLYSDGVIADG